MRKTIQHIKMHWLLLFILSLNYSSSIYAQSNKKEGNEILWSVDRPLTWADFKGPVNKTNKHQAAMIATGVFMELESNDDNDSLIVVVKAIAYKRDSWKDKSAVSDYLLNHEQLHFNITELYARMLRKEIGNLSLFGNKLINEINKLYKNNMKKLRIRQNLYDSETNHSLDQEQQSHWNQMISDELECYKTWTDTELRIALYATY